MTVHPTDADNIQAQSNPSKQASALATVDTGTSKEANAANISDNRHGAATTARQWQVLSQLQRNRWVGTTHIYEQLMMAGFDISLRTVQRDLNALAKRFPIEKKQCQSSGLALERRRPITKFAAYELITSGCF